MPFPFRRALSATVSTARLRLRRRGLSTAATIPPWAIIHQARLFSSPELHSSFLFAEPPRTSHLLVPAHLVNPRLHPDAAWKPMMGTTVALGGTVRATSGDGLLLLQFVDGVSTDPTIARLRGSGSGEWFRVDVDPDVTRFVCNPISGELFRLPDIDGTKKVPIPWHPHGLLTRSIRGHGPPDRYAVAELTADGQGEEQSFVMRRFLSETGEWEKLVALPSPLPFPRRINMDHEVVAFAGRLYWIDLNWGAISADPFSDRPELRFVELPRDSVWPVPNAGQIAVQSMCRRMGVSEGKLRYVELLHGDLCYVLNSFALDNDGKSWTLEHQVVFSRIWADAGAKEDIPRIGVIDPLNATIMYLIIGSNSQLAVEMNTGKVLQCSMLDEVDVVGPSPTAFAFSAFLKPCLFPPWIGSSQIPHAGTLSRNKNIAKSNTLADILVRVDRDKKN